VSKSGQLEKRLAWHVLIPVRSERRVFLEGFPEGAAELWYKLRGEEVVPQSSSADVTLYWDPSPKDILLGIEGCVVVGPKKSIPEAVTSGKSWSLLPASDPRLVLPLQNKEQLQRGLTMHRPGRRIARALVSIMKLAARCGWVTPLERRVLWMSGIGTPEFGDDAVLYLGTDDDDRKTTILPVKGVQVLKYGFSNSAKSALSREAKALTAMAETPLAKHVPKKIGIETRGAAIVLKQEYRVRQKLSKTDLREFACNFLADMTEIDAEQRPFSNILEVDTSVAEHLSTLRNPSDIILGYRSHGDFAPWNMMATKQSFFVFDWEDSVSWAPAFSDAFQFIVAPAIHTSKVMQPKNVAADAFRFAKDVAKKSGISDKEIPFYWGLWLAVQQEKKPTHLVASMLEHLEIV